jgi:hypothetical protein
VSKIKDQYYWIREHVNPGGFEMPNIHHCRTDRIVADIFTKSLSGSLFFKRAETLNEKRIRSSDDFVTNTKRNKSQM